MHELLLFGQIRPTQYSQVLSILAGIAAMQPQPILERHLVFKPTRPPGSPRSGPVESSILGMPDAQLQAFYAQTKGDTYYVHLVADLNPAETTNNINYNTTNHKEENDKPKEEEKRGENNSMQVDVDVDVDLKIKQEGGGDDDRGDVKNQPHDNNNNNNNNDNGVSISDGTSPKPHPDKWILQFRDLPEVAGRRPVVSRLIADYHLTTTDPFGFMTVLNHTHTATFHISGHRLTHLSTSIILSRILIPNSPNLSTKKPSRLLDPSGTYLLQVSLRVQDGSKPELMTRGISELLAVKEMLKGVVELVVGERLSLDTRVR